MSKEKLVSVKMSSIGAGPNGTRHKGKCYPVSVAEATALVEGGYAEYETTMVAVPKGSTAAAAAIKKLKDDEDAQKLIDAQKVIDDQTAADATLNATEKAAKDAKDVLLDKAKLLRIEVRDEDTAEVIQAEIIRVENLTPAEKTARTKELKKLEKDLQDAIAAACEGCEKSADCESPEGCEKFDDNGVPVGFNKPSVW